MASCGGPKLGKQEGTTCSVTLVNIGTEAQDARDVSRGSFSANKNVVSGLFGNDPSKIAGLDVLLQSNFVLETLTDNFQRGLTSAEHLLAAILSRSQKMREGTADQLNAAVSRINAAPFQRRARSSRERLVRRRGSDTAERNQVSSQGCMEKDQVPASQQEGLMYVSARTSVKGGKMQLPSPSFASVSLPLASVTASKLTPLTEQGSNSMMLQAGASERDADEDQTVDKPTVDQLLKHPAAIVACIPKNTAMFLAGAISGALAKTTTAPLDRVKLLMQVRGVQAPEAGKQGLGLVDAIMKIGKEEGVTGYWKGNLPQVLRVIPYSAVQLFVYDYYKRLFQGQSEELSVPGRLAAGACAGMTSTLVTYPLDVLRLRLAVDPACKSMSQVAASMLREEGAGAFYRGLGPSLLGIAPYIAINFCAFDLIKKAMPEEMRKSSFASFLPAFLSAAMATVSCYPLDTVRRQLQMRGTPYTTVLDAIPGVIAKEGVIGLYRGFLANALKNLPNSSIRLGTYDAAKSIINLSKGEFENLVAERRAARQAKSSKGLGKVAGLPTPPQGLDS